VVNYAGGKCVFVETDESNGFTLTADMIEAAYHLQNKLLMIKLAKQSERRGAG